MDIVDCNIPCVCKNASMSVYPHDCDDMLHESLDIVAMNNALYTSMDIVDCNMPCVCENASISVNPHNCDDMLLESMGVVDKLLKKEAKKFQKNLGKFICEKDDLIAKLNESNKLVEKYKKLVENSLEKMKEFEC